MLSNLELPVSQQHGAYRVSLQTALCGAFSSPHLSLKAIFLVSSHPSSRLSPWYRRLNLLVALLATYRYVEPPHVPVSPVRLVGVR